MLLGKVFRGGIETPGTRSPLALSGTALWYYYKVIVGKIVYICKERINKYSM